MKKIMLLVAIFATSLITYAQIQTPAPSPFTKVEQTVGLTDVTLEYSRPNMRGRTIFGDLVPHGEVWRTGANQRTKITFSDDVVIAGQTLKAGTYAIFTKPSEKSWEVYFYTDYAGVSTSAISGLEESQSDIDATVQIRTGVEYLIIKPKYLIPLRGGLFYDPAPSEGDSDDFYGFALGSGVAWKQFIFDVGYQYRFGSDVGSAIFKSGEMSQDVQEHTFYASLIVHF